MGRLVFRYQSAWAVACWGVLVGSALNPAGAQDEAAVMERRFSGWGHAPLVGGGVYGGGGYEHQSVFALQPLWAPVLEESASSGSLWFVQPQLSRWGGDEWVASVGLGFRHLFGPVEKQELANLLGEGWFIGANAFFDMAGTARGHDFQQWGLGFELGSRYLTLRGNYYLPDSGRHQYASETTVRSLPSQERTRDNYSLDVRPEGNIADIGIVWDRQTQIRRRSLFTTVDSFETALQGWDLELMAMVPKIDRYVDLRLLAGLYDYEGGLSGGRFGLELRPVPALVLSALWMEDGGWTRIRWAGALVGWSGSAIAAGGRAQNPVDPAQSELERTYARACGAAKSADARR